MICVFISVDLPLPPELTFAITDCVNQAGFTSGPFFSLSDLMKQCVGTLISRWIIFTGRRAQAKLSFTVDLSDAGQGVHIKGAVLTLGLDYLPDQCHCGSLCLSG